MKKILFTIIFTSLFFSCSNDESTNNDELNIQLAQCIPSGLQGNLIAFYPFNNGSLDDVSNSNNLTNLTSALPTIDRNGNIDCAYKFESINNEYLTTTNTSFLDNLSEFSISLWFKMDSSGGYSVLISRDESTSTPCDVFGQWSLGLYDSDYPTFGLMGSVWDLYDWQGSIDIIDFNEWHHLIATYKTTNNELEIYRDGILRNSSTGICDIPAAPTYQDIGDLFIGKFYNGQIDDIAIFNTALNQTQVTEMFQMETCCL